MESEIKSLIKDCVKNHNQKKSFNLDVSIGPVSAVIDCSAHKKQYGSEQFYYGVFEYVGDLLDKVAPGKQYEMHVKVLPHEYNGNNVAIAVDPSKI